MGRGTLLALVFAGCGIDAVGTAPPPLTQALPDASVVFDAGPGRADAGCRSITTGTPGSLVAPKVATPTIDGDLSEWTSCFVTVDRDTAYSVRNLAGGATLPRAEFSVAHDGDKIYVAARVTGVPPFGDHGVPEIWRNDSFEAYFDADGQTQADYGSDAMQIIVDPSGRMQGFRSKSPVDPSGARAAVKVDPNGVTYTIELEVAASTLGASGFANVVGFDVAVNDGSGDDQLSQLFWFQKCRKDTGCGCQSGEDFPYCDSRQFGSVMLER